MDSLANYDSEDEIDASSSSYVISDKATSQFGMEGDNYDDVQMDMSENPLNGSKAPSNQAHYPGQSGGTPPTSATTQLDSSSESVSKEDCKCSPQISNPGSPESAQSSSHGESDEDAEKSKSEEPLPQSSSESKQMKDKAESACDNSNKDSNHSRREYENRSDRDRERDKFRDRERDRERDRDKRKDYRRDDRHRSGSKDRKDRPRSSERSERRRSRERNELRKSRERRSSSREYRWREADRRHSDPKGRDYDRKRNRSRSRSVDRRRPGNDSRSSSSSGGSRNEARSRDSKVPTSGGLSKRSRSRSRSPVKERSKLLGGEPRKFYLEKKIDRKLNVLERMGIELKAEAKSSAGTVTPQMLVQRTMEQEAEQVKKATGVELPSYYNAAAVNPQRLVDQIQKRKLLWGARKDDPAKAVAQPQVANNWQGATFAQDQDGRVTAKFKRLMGIKQTPQVPANSSGEVAEGSEIIKKQEEMFHNMESQYEVARLATHTHRGLGLGFGTFQPR